MNRSIITIIFLLFNGSLLLDAQPLISLYKGEKLPMSMSSMTIANHENKIYLVGGYSDKLFTRGKNLLMHDFSTKEWLNLSGFVSSSLNNGSAIYLPDFNGLLYVGGNKWYIDKYINDLSIVYLDRFQSELVYFHESLNGASLSRWNELIFIYGGTTLVRRQEQERITVSKQSHIFSLNPNTSLITPLKNPSNGLNYLGEIVGDTLYTVAGWQGNNYFQENRDSLFINAFLINENEWVDIATINVELCYPEVHAFDNFLLIHGNKRFYPRNSRGVAPRTVSEARNDLQNNLVLFNLKSKEWKEFELDYLGTNPALTIVNDTLHMYGGKKFWGASRQHKWVPTQELIHAFNAESF